MLSLWFALPIAAILAGLGIDVLVRKVFRFRAKLRHAFRSLQYGDHTSAPPLEAGLKSIASSGLGQASGFDDSAAASMWIVLSNPSQILSEDMQSKNLWPLDAQRKHHRL